MGRWLRITVVFLVVFCTSSVLYASPVFKKGDYGTDVELIQSKLNELGYSVGTVDGSYGSATAAAVLAFQRDKGLEADGIVGYQTYQFLVGREFPVSRDGSTVTARRAIQAAMNFIGVPYRFGGTTPSGFDCSGFVQYVFAQSGVYLPRMADEQFMVGHPVSFYSLQPGDLVFFTTYAPGASHSGIYLGDGTFISATSSRGVAIAPIGSGYWGARYIGARRL